MNLKFRSGENNCGEISFGDYGLYDFVLLGYFAIFE